MGLMDIFQAFSFAATARKGRTGQGAKGGRGAGVAWSVISTCFSVGHEGIAACGGVHLKCHCVCRRLCKFCSLLLLLQL